MREESVMDSKMSIAGILISVSALAKKRGLIELDERVSEAATATLLDTPGWHGVNELGQLQSAFSTGQLRMTG